ncbi:hypothetical protein HU200_062716 [Digitaria exilis]|uniref:F-box domain-containing protein n=1 Tax=Digitaria exilis TaxID=1010633 RepID=A0A835DVN1_9POAL|nr:hypothetical protein HU200_062716 [Digitaria exilis]
MSSSQHARRRTAAPASPSPPLLQLPDHLAVDITICVAATSMWPMEDLRSLRATCKAMRVACATMEVGRCLPLGLDLERVLMHDINIHKRFLFRDTLVDNLTKVSNLET